MNIKDTILKREYQPELVPLTVVEWGDVYVKPMNAGEVDAYEGECYTMASQGKQFANFRSRLLVRVLVDKDGVRIFSDDDDAALGKLAYDEVKRAFEFAAPLCKVSKEDEKDIEKNS